MNSKDTLDALLKKNRDHEKTSGPGSNNHVPMVLVALYRLGGSSDQMNRYVETFDLAEGATPLDHSKTESITLENWQAHMGRGKFSQYVDFFENWMKVTSVETVLKESLPILTKGVSSVAYHALLRLGYALDYGSREEATFSLAYWAAYFYSGPDFDVNETPVEPDKFLADIVHNASTLQIEETESIDGRIRQVYDSNELAKLWKPISVADSNPLERMSALILETFTGSQHFTLLHALTSCQALRLALPYLSDLKNSLSSYWHSVCAAYLTVYHSRFEVGRDTIEDGEAEWHEIVVRAADEQVVMAFEHTIKLTYTCWLEFQHYKRERYLSLATRELNRPSQFV